MLLKRTFNVSKIIKFISFPYKKPFYICSGIHLLENSCAWTNFKNIFSRPLFTIIFSEKIEFMDTDSILRVKTMYDSVK